MTEQKDKASIDYAYYTKWRNKLYETYSKAWESLSKNLLFLSSGALALTLTFFTAFGKKIENGYVFESIILVQISWVSFVITIALTLLSICTTILASHEAMKKWDEAYENDKEVSHASCINTITGIVTVLALISFLLGVFLFVIFAVVNV